MYLEQENLIWDKNSVGEYYLINLQTGAKCTWFPPHGGICPDLITRGDVTRALTDGIDISELRSRHSPLTREEYADFVEWAYSWRKNHQKK